MTLLPHNNNLNEAPDAFEAQFRRIWKYNDCEVAFARAKWRYRLINALGRSAETTLYLMVALALLQMAATRLLNRKFNFWVHGSVEEESLEAQVLEEAEGALRRGRVGRRARQQLIWWIEMQRIFRRLPALAIAFCSVALELFTAPQEGGMSTVCYGHR